MRKILLASPTLIAAAIAGLCGVPQNPDTAGQRVEIRAPVANNSRAPSPASAAASQSGSALVISANALGDYTADHVSLDEPASYNRAGHNGPKHSRTGRPNRVNKPEIARCRLAGA